MPPMWYCTLCTAATGFTTAVHHSAGEDCPNDPISDWFEDGQ